MSNYLSFIVMLGFLISCSDQNTTHKSSHKTANLIVFANTFEVIKDGENKRIHIINPESKTVEKYFLTKNTTTIIPKGYTSIKVPISSLIALSGTHIGMLSKINGISKIVGVSDKKYIFNTVLLKNINSGKVIDFGSESSIPFESIVKTNAQVLIYSGFGQQFPQNKQLLKMGTVCIPNYDWKENHPLGKAEWIKLFGYLIGKEKEATSYFIQIVKEYNTLKTKASKLKISPSVFSGNLIGDIWYTPAGESFTANQFKDANADYIYAKTKGIGSIELSMEKILTDNSNTKFWINPGASSIKELIKQNPKMNYFSAVKNKNVYCYSPKMNEFWELSAIEPQHVLSDLIRILHPNKQTNDPLYFYQNICQ